MVKTLAKLSLYVILLLQVLILVGRAHASSDIQLEEIVWFQLPSQFENETNFSNTLLRENQSTLIASPMLTGGHYLSSMQFFVYHSGWYVIDFSGSGLVGNFNHQVVDFEREIIASFSGGVNSSIDNPYMLRNGRRVFLDEGFYELLTRQESQFNIATPTPYIEWEETYLKSIKIGNALTLFGLGIFAGLGLFYFVLACYRRRKADLAYSIFILGNLLFNATALLALSDILGISWYSGASYPIFVSNIAYVIFVVLLLDIHRGNNPVLHKIAIGIISVFILFLIAAPLAPNWQMEMNRIGVGIFLAFGLLAGLRVASQGSIVARLYLLANLGFFVLAMVAITQNGIAGEPAIYMSHIGLLAVAIEVVLLSFVLAYQMNVVSKEKAVALSQAKKSLEIAQTDSLTKTRNRYALDIELKSLSSSAAFYYLDLDGLKACNDDKGHMFGDSLLSNFASYLQKELGELGKLYRIGGDEFGLIHDVVHRERVEAALEKTQTHMRENFYPKFGISCGLAINSEHSSPYRMVEVADQRMYKQKTTKRASSYGSNGFNQDSIAS